MSDIPSRRIHGNSCGRCPRRLIQIHLIRGGLRGKGIVRVLVIGLIHIRMSMSRVGNTVSMSRHLGYGQLMFLLTHILTGPMKGSGHRSRSLSNNTHYTTCWDELPFVR